MLIYPESVHIDVGQYLSDAVTPYNWSHRLDVSVCATNQLN